MSNYGYSRVITFVILDAILLLSVALWVLVAYRDGKAVACCSSRICLVERHHPVVGSEP